ncbi:hypothetical protein [Bacillus sp. T3]|nr:hypothetical protein [Bacillus sp. T3]
MSVVSVIGLKKSFKDKEVIADVDFSLSTWKMYCPNRSKWSW